VHEKHLSAKWIFAVPQSMGNNHQQQYTIHSKTLQGEYLGFLLSTDVTGID
jgi:hypothetical protein